MPEWNDEKFKYLLTPNIWNSNYENIKKILSMKEWKDDKYDYLLTSSIWYNTPKEIEKILSMPEWKDDKFKNLLTPTIWSSNYNDIKKKLNLEYFKEDKYLQLLKPTIFSLTTKNIINGIELLKEYGIDQYVTNNCLRFKTKFLKNLLDYLTENNIGLVTYNEKIANYSLNPILNTAKCQLKKRYNIDVNLIEKGNFKRNK